jgi:hypothetical protein
MPSIGRSIEVQHGAALVVTLPAAQIPGPGHYDNANGKGINGGRFSKFTPKGYVDDCIKKGTPSMPHRP